MLRQVARLRASVKVRRAAVIWEVAAVLTIVVGLVLLLTIDNHAVIVTGILAALPVSLWGRWEQGRDRARRYRLEQLAQPRRSD